MLYQFGLITFERLPVNAVSVNRQAGADHVEKDVIGGLRPMEFMGEGGDVMTIAGRLFPEKFGGSIDSLHTMRVAGMPHVLTRGDGVNLGWRVIESVNERGEFLGTRGVGKVIDFDVTLKLSGPPSAGQYIETLIRLFQ